jgi:anti-sigma regulatory factor (Ser/Thr protein kinase)
MRAFAEEHSADRDLHGRVALAFTEALTNAIRHAYDGEPPADDDICVFADVDDGTLEIVVVDHGRGLRADSRTPGIGEGLKIIAECTDAFRIAERRPAGVEVWMRFNELVDAPVAQP